MPSHGHVAQVHCKEKGRACLRMVRCLAGFWVLVLGPIATWGWDQEAQSGPILVTHGRSEFPIIIFPRFILGIYRFIT